MVFLVGRGECFELVQGGTDCRHVVGDVFHEDILAL
jgi:hypothetical protein